MSRRPRWPAALARTSLALVLVGGLLATPRSSPAAGAAGVEGPVAVLPFKNLNANPKLDWLSVGIAETMVSDVKKSGRVQVVERDQIDKALAQIALQGDLKMAPATAVKVGKIVGAKTIVLGAYQEAGTQVRITARFVSVETGVVKDAAKVTGPLTRIFHLQDAIVARLIGGRPGHRYHAPNREQGSARTVKAYRLYAMSLQVASDVQRVSYLRRAVKVDPHLHYAVDALDALERKLAGYDAKDQQVRLVRARGLLAELQQPGLEPQVRARKAMQLFSADMTGRRWGRLRADVRAVLKMPWPAENPPLGPGLPAPPPIPEVAAYYRFLALVQLKRHDLALQYGRDFLKHHSGSAYYQGVRIQMTVMIEDRRRQAQGAVDLKKDLAEIDQDRADYLARMKRLRRPVKPAFLRTLDRRRCQSMESEHQHRRAIVACEAFLEAHTDETDKAARSDRDFVRLFLMRAHANLGQFDAARRIARRLHRESPAFYKQMAITWAEQGWPVDDGSAP